MKGFLKAIFMTVLLAGMMIIPASAAEDQEVNWGDTNYQIAVPGFIETRDIIINGQNTSVIVVQKPEEIAKYRYHFFDAVTTDANVTHIMSHVYNLKLEVIGDYMTELENGRASYVPYLYDDFDTLSKEPIYCGFSFMGVGDQVIYDFPIWVVFEDKK
jgi:hypothetical protein